MARHTAKSHKIRKVEILVIQTIICGNSRTFKISFVDRCRSTLTQKTIPSFIQKTLEILSGYEQSDMIDSAIEAETGGFVEKPLFRSTLRNCLLKHLLAGSITLQHTISVV